MSELGTTPAARSPRRATLRRLSALAVVPVLAATSLAALSRPAAAETDLSFYLGTQEAAHSRVRGDDPAGSGPFNFLAKWEGKSFAMPPYYGFRATWWRNDGPLGFAVDFNHTKVYASDKTMRDNGFKTLEFTDGLNILTADVLYRWQNAGRWTPYVGAGLGIAVPHVEVQTTSGPKTFKYEYGGPAVAAVAGVSYRLTDHWSMFGEYKGVYSRNDVDLEGGGYLKTNIVTNALNLGVSYSF